MPIGEHLSRCVVCGTSFVCGDAVVFTCPPCECKERGHLPVLGFGICGRCGERIAGEGSPNKDATINKPKATVISQPSHAGDRQTHTLWEELCAAKREIVTLKAHLMYAYLVLTSIANSASLPCMCGRGEYTGGAMCSKCIAYKLVDDISRSKVLDGEKNG